MITMDPTGKNFFGQIRNCPFEKTSIGLFIPAKNFVANGIFRAEYISGIVIFSYLAFVKRFAAITAKPHFVFKWAVFKKGESVSAHGVPLVFNIVIFPGTFGLLGHFSKLRHKH